MKPTDRIILTRLRDGECQSVSDVHWGLVEKAVEEAGDIRNVTGYARTVLFDAITKARFSSRSEAGRYAANMRWKGQGERTAGAKGDAKLSEVGGILGRFKAQPVKIGDSKVAGGVALKVTTTAATLDKLFGKGNYIQPGGDRDDPGERKVTEEWAAKVTDSNTGETFEVQMWDWMRYDEAGMSQDEGRKIGQMGRDEEFQFSVGTTGSGTAEVVASMIQAMDESGKSDSGFGTRTMEEFTPSEVRDDEEAQTKQDFIDAQKERLGNMGRGTSQSAYMALESGIKRLEAELASGDTSEARNRPGQFFDDRPGSKGDRYIGYRPNKEVAVDIRRDIKSAVERGELPEGLKFSVKMDARGRAIRVRVAGVQNPRIRDDLGRDVTSPEAKAIYDKVDRITNAYNRYNSDVQTDYFDVDYYGFVSIDE